MENNKFSSAAMLTKRMKIIPNTLLKVLRYILLIIHHIIFSEYEKFPFEYVIHILISLLVIDLFARTMHIFLF